MKIFITGGNGFIGSNFINGQIKNENVEILNFDKLTYAGNLDNLKYVDKMPNYRFVKGDIGDYEKVRIEINRFKPEILINFAAESHVDRSIDGPLDFINTNILGTYYLLQASCDYFFKNKSFKFIHISTDEVYGSLGKKGFFKETTPYSPNSPYSASKASSDHLVNAWHHTYGLPTIITNCSNNYGPYQFPEKLIPLIIANCLDSKPLPVYGDGQNIRDWLFVEDHCDAINLIAKKGKIGQTYNIGGSNEITNLNIVNTICKELDLLCPSNKLDSYKELITFVEDRPGHDFRYAIDSSKIQNELGWRPKESFQSGIIKTINWYIENEEWWRKIQSKEYKQERLGLNT